MNSFSFVFLLFVCVLMTINGSEDNMDIIKPDDAQFQDINANTNKQQPHEAKEGELEECTCTVTKKLFMTAGAGLAATAFATAFLFIPGVGQAAALGAVLSATEASAAVGFGSAAVAATGYIVAGECNC